MILIMAVPADDRRTDGDNGAVTAKPHAHSGAHDHSDAMRRTAAKNVGRLWFAFVLTAVFVVVEVVTAFVADSLALLSDAAHMATDAVEHRVDAGRDRGGQPGASATASAPSGCSGSRSSPRSSTRSCCSPSAIYVLIEAVIRLRAGRRRREGGPDARRRRSSACW